MVRRLLAGEPADRRQDPEGIGRQEDDVLRAGRDAGRVGVADEVERIRGPGVLGEPLRVEVQLPRLGEHVGVLEDRPEALGGGEDVGLVHRGQADRLGIAATLEVEGVAVAPAVLVVADQASLRIGRERGLPGTAEAEEDARITAGAHVDRGVHRQHALVGHQVVHDGERGLLDLAGVLRPDDDDLHPPQVEQDRRAGAGPVGRRVGLEAGHVDDREVGDEGREVLLRRPAEEVAGEDAGPGGLGVDAEAAAVLGVRTDVHVLCVELLVRDVLDEPRPETVVVLLADLVVHVAPPDLVLAPGLADDELVLGRAARVLAGVHDERAVGGDGALAGADRVLVELGHRQVGDDAGADEWGRRGIGQRHGQYLGCGAGARPCRWFVTGRASRA